MQGPAHHPSHYCLPPAIPVMLRCWWMQAGKKLGKRGHLGHSAKDILKKERMGFVPCTSYCSIVSLVCPGGTTVSRCPPCVFSSPGTAAPRCTGHDDRRLDIPRVSAKLLPELRRLTSGDLVSRRLEAQGRSRALQPVVLIKNLRSKKASVQRSKCGTTFF